MERGSGQGLHGSTRAIQVVVRVRPPQPHESGHGTGALQIDSRRGLITVGATAQQGMGKDRYMRNFSYDAVLDETETQEDLYKRARVEEMVEAALQGFHGTLFAYGQTGSGKTHCMEGFKYKRLKVTNADGKKTEPRAVFEETPPDRLGMVPRAVLALFQSVNRQSHRKFSVSVSYVQIYKEQVYDLLNISSFRPNMSRAVSKGGMAGLKMRWSRNREFYLENVYQSQCTKPQEVMDLYQTGINNKVMASHKMNAQSSRSHCLFTLHIESHPKEAPEELTSSKLTLVDLAGSERAAAAGSTSGSLQEESISINKSLFALRKVITALAEGKAAGSAHIPFRDSKLTSLLKHSLGGSSMTTMIACLTPSDMYIEENLSTLDYSSRARAITNKIIINEDPKTRLIRELRAQILFLQEQLAASHISMPAFEQALGTPAPVRDVGRSEATSGPRAPTTLSGSLPRVSELNKNQEEEENAIAGAQRNLQQMHHSTSTTQNTPGPGKMNCYPNTAALRARTKEEVVSQVENMGEYLLQSVSLLNQLGKTNTSLRKAYTDVYTRYQDAKVSNDQLMTENSELNGKVSMLESVVQAESSADGMPGGTGSNQKQAAMHTTSAAVLMELSDLRRENELLRGLLEQKQDRGSVNGVPTAGRSSLEKSRGSLHRTSSARLSSQKSLGSPHRQSRASDEIKGPASGTLSVKQLENMLSGGGSPTQRSPAPVNRSQSHWQAWQPGTTRTSSNDSRKKEPLPGYMNMASPGSDSGEASNYSFSAVSGSTLRITTTGKLLPTASGHMASPSGRLASQPPRVESPDLSGGSTKQQPEQRLNELFAARNSLSRSRHEKI